MIDGKSGGHVCTCAPMDIRIARPLAKTLSLPEPCRGCADTHYTYRMPGHPDDGTQMTCGILKENRDAGRMEFTCPYRRTIPDSFTVVEDIGEERIMCKGPEGKCMCGPENTCTIRGIIDADKTNADRSIADILHRRKAVLPSPHSFLDDAMAYRIQPKEAQ